MENKFSYNLKRLRVERGLSQKALAEELQTTLKTISHWETGYTEPSIDMILKMSFYFDISTDELLGKE